MTYILRDTFSRSLVLLFSLVAIEAQTMFENSQPIPIPPLHCVQVVRRSGVVGNIGNEFWRLANLVERIYVYLILWRLTVGTGDRTGLYETLFAYN